MFGEKLWCVLCCVDGRTLVHLKFKVTQGWRRPPTKLAIITELWLGAQTSRQWTKNGRWSVTFKPNEVETYNFMYTNITMDNSKFPQENIPKFNNAKKFLISFNVLWKRTSFLKKKSSKGLTYISLFISATSFFCGYT